MTARRSLPATLTDYVALQPSGLPRGVTGMALASAADAIVAAIREHGTLHGWAATQPGRRAMHGRGVAWAVKLPGWGDADGLRVVVRHSRHGGLLAPITGDLFLPPTRAPAELTAALRLAAAGVPTPLVVAYATYAAPLPPFRRSDVATAEIENGHDLPAALAHWPTERDAIVLAVARLITALTNAGARHPDLNVKNILLTLDGMDDAGSHRALAHVLDVDRVSFSGTGDERVTQANLQRFTHSARRWRERRGPLLDDAELATIERIVRTEAA